MIPSVCWRTRARTLSICSLFTVTGIDEFGWGRESTHDRNPSYDRKGTRGREKKKKKKIEKRTDVICKIPVYLLWPDLEWSRLSSQSSPIQVLLFYWYARIPESLTKTF